MNRISIVGVGLIGGSIGIDARKMGLAKEVVGVVRRAESIDECIKAGAVDKATLDIKEGVEKADMIILATPISIMEKIAEEIVKYTGSETIVIDVASVKGELVKKIEGILGTRYVGTHPMAGAEKKGVSDAKSGLFYGATCIITPTEKTRPKCLKDVKEFWEKLRAKIIVLPPCEHDKVVGMISHLPHLVAASMVNIISDEQRALSCIGPGFKDSTRIAGSPPELWQEICEWNKEEILASIDKFQKEFAGVRNLIETSNWAGLLEKLRKAREIRGKL